MTANYTTGGLVPDDRFDIPELLNGTFQLLLFGITRFQILAWVVIGGDEPLNRDFLQFHFVCTSGVIYDIP